MGRNSVEELIGTGPDDDSLYPLCSWRDERKLCSRRFGRLLCWFLVEGVGGACDGLDL